MARFQACISGMATENLPFKLKWNNNLSPVLFDKNSGKISVLLPTWTGSECRFVRIIQARHIDSFFLDRIYWRLLLFLFFNTFSYERIFGRRKFSFLNHLYSDNKCKASQAPSFHVLFVRLFDVC